MASWTEHSRFALSLFALISPMAAIPVFLGLTQHFGPRDKAKVASIAAITLWAALTGGYYVGEPLITALGSSIASFQIAGGLIIGLSGFSMLQGPVPAPDKDLGSDVPTSVVAVGIVPIGMPMLAGPGALTAVMLEGHGHAVVTHEEIVLSIMFACSGLTWLTLLFAGAIARVVGTTGLTVFQRIFGLIVISVGVEFLARGIHAHVHSFIGR